MTQNYLHFQVNAVRQSRGRPRNLADRRGDATTCTNRDSRADAKAGHALACSYWPVKNWHGARSMPRGTFMYSKCGPVP